MEEFAMEMMCAFSDAPYFIGSVPPSLTMEEMKGETLVDLLDRVNTRSAYDEASFLDEVNAYQEFLFQVLHRITAPHDAGDYYRCPRVHDGLLCVHDMRIVMIDMKNQIVLWRTGLQPWMVLQAGENTGILNIAARPLTCKSATRTAFPYPPRSTT